MSQGIRLQISLGCAILLGIPGKVHAQEPIPKNFNSYVVRAVEELSNKSLGQGYDIRNAFTHDVKYGDRIIRSSKPPLTMCVAGVAEVIVTAINLYVEETGDREPYSYLPADSWNRMRPKDIRSHIWVSHQLDSYGTADAIVTFGIGRRVKFSELEPGSFVNINRTNKSGHAVVFLSYVDKNGNNLPAYSQDVAGFRYFSAQGVGQKPGAGLGYRVAFFTYSDNKKICPDSVPDGTKRDCGVIYSLSQKMLNTGYMLYPKRWDSNTRDRNLQALANGLYKQSRSRGPGFMGLPSTLNQSKFMYRIEKQDTMQLNPVFMHANETTDDE